jgi:hypothetical protein
MNCKACDTDLVIGVNLSRILAKRGVRSCAKCYRKEQRSKWIATRAAKPNEPVFASNDPVDFWNPSGADFYRHNIELSGLQRANKLRLLKLRVDAQIRNLSQ